MFFVFRLCFVVFPLLYLWATLSQAPWDVLLYQGLSPDLNLVIPLVALFAFSLRVAFSRKQFAKFLVFCDTLEHEFSHVLVGFFHFKTPGELKVSDRGTGHITLNNTSTLICLAPYILPLGALFLTLISPLFIPVVRETISYLISFLIGNYLFRLKREIHSGQSDFEIAGKFFSYLIIFSVNLSWMSLIILNWIDWVSLSQSWLYFMDFTWSFF